MQAQSRSKVDSNSRHTASFVVAFLLAMAAYLAVLLASGCKTTEALKEPVAGVLVQYAAVKVIDGDIDRAAHVVAICDAVLASLDGGETAATVDALEALARAKIDWAGLDPADTLLVDLLLQRVTAELKDRLGESLLPDEQRLAVASVIGWVRTAAIMIQ